MAPSPKLTLMETTSTTEKKIGWKPIAVSARFSIKASDIDMAHTLVQDLNEWLQNRLGEQVLPGDEEKTVGELTLTSLTIEINGITYS